MSVSVNRKGPVAVVTIDNPPVNASSQAVRQGVLDAVYATEVMDDVLAVVLGCAGRTFVAGADVREFGKPPLEPHLPDVIAAIESAQKPWVAALHGSVLGGGLEIALGCAYRIAKAGTKLGFPEVTLGIVPGAGGTVRLPRLISARAALDMITSGKPVSAEKAKSLGLIDETVETDLEQAALEFAANLTERPIALTKRDAHPIPSQTEWEEALTAIDRKARGQKAPGIAAALVTASISGPADAAFAAERAAFLQLKSEPQAAALRHIFFAERSAARMKVTEGVPPLAFGSVGVVGGGTMGVGIAVSCLMAGLRVTLVERDDEASARSKQHLVETLLQSRERGVLSAEGFETAQACFKGSADFKDLARADLVIEAVFEEMAAKKAVFAQLDDVISKEAVLATNTSYLDINEIAAHTADPSRIIGLHFFSPAHIMKLLELIVTQHARPEVLATGLALGKALGKIIVPAGVCDGFVGNRIMSAYRREADYMLEDGALPQDIDSAMRAFGFPMGVFEMQDLAGLDIAWAMRKRRAINRPASERYVGIADALCEKGRLGRKTGKGWYDYSINPKGDPDPIVEKLIEDASAAQGISRKSLDADEIMSRILNIMQTEGRGLVAEGIVASEDAVDVVMVNGYGFPRWRGGPMFMAGRKMQDD